MVEEQDHRWRVLRVSIGPVGVDAVVVGGAAVVVAAVVAWAGTLSFVRVATDPNEGANIGAGSVFLVLLLLGCAIGGYLAAGRRADHPVMNGLAAVAAGYTLVAGVSSLFGEPAAMLAVATFFAPLALGAAVSGAVFASRRHQHDSSGL